MMQKLYKICLVLCECSGFYEILISKYKMEIKKLIGLLPQDFSVYPDLTAYEFLDYMAKLNGVKDKKARRELILNLLEKVNLLLVSYSVRKSS